MVHKVGIEDLKDMNVIVLKLKADLILYSIRKVNSGQLEDLISHK